MKVVVRKQFSAIYNDLSRRICKITTLRYSISASMLIFSRKNICWLFSFYSYFRSFPKDWKISKSSLKITLKLEKNIIGNFSTAVAVGLKIVINIKHFQQTHVLCIRSLKWSATTQIQLDSLIFNVESRVWTLTSYYTEIRLSYSKLSWSGLYHKIELMTVLITLKLMR